MRIFGFLVYVTTINPCNLKGKLLFWVCLDGTSVKVMQLLLTEKQIKQDLFLANYYKAIFQKYNFTVYIARPKKNY